MVKELEIPVREENHSVRQVNSSFLDLFHIYYLLLETTMIPRIHCALTEPVLVTRQRGHIIRPSLF